MNESQTLYIYDINIKYLDTLTGILKARKPPVVFLYK
jgi:hypothetical protein